MPCALLSLDLPACLPFWQNPSQEGHPELPCTGPLNLPSDRHVLCQAAPPNIYIYEYPSMKLRKVLRNGTECAFTALAFNNAGNMLGSVGSYPDYMLTLWRWEEEKVVLRAKAFSQEVFNIAFSPFFDGSLITSGTGHIRFWKMASTFTGLKLQVGAPVLTLGHLPSCILGTPPGRCLPMLCGPEVRRICRRGRSGSLVPSSCPMSRTTLSSPTARSCHPQSPGT